MKWTKFTDRQRLATDAERVAMQDSEPLPPPRKMVLVRLMMLTETGERDPKWPDCEACVVGYLKFSAGDKACPYFVCHAIQGHWTPIAWCDCLPEDFDRWGKVQGD